MTVTLANGFREELLPPPVERILSAPKLWGGPLPSLVSLMVDVDPEIYEQGYTSTCPGQSSSAAWRMVQAMRGNGREKDTSAPSRRWIYDEASATHGERDVDEGTYLSACLRIMREVGYPTEEHWGWDDSIALSTDDEARTRWVCEHPGASVRHHAIDQKGAVEEYAILDYGDALEDAIKRALVAGYPVVCGGQVTRDWQALDTWDPCDMVGPIAGGHAMVIVGYDQDGYHLRNSWGWQWGVGGCGRVTPRVVREVLRSYHAVTNVRGATT